MTHLEVATADYDSQLRALLRENEMASWVTMTLEREPSLFSSLDRFGRDRVVIGRRDGKPVGMYMCAQHPVHVDGQATEVGYLGGLRVAQAYRHRPGILRDGYASLPTLALPTERPYWYTTIAADNAAARRILEADLPGLPHYEPVGDLVTLALPRARGHANGFWRPAAAADMGAVCALYNAQAQAFQFAPVLTPERAQRTGARFYVHGATGAPAACMALWNQQDHKQVVVRGYRRSLGALRPLYNLYAKLGRRVCLPSVGAPLDQSFLAFFAAPAAAPSDLPDLVRAALGICGSPVLTLGLHAQHPALAPLQRQLRPEIYRTCVYTVRFGAPPALDGRPPQPEVAVL